MDNSKRDFIKKSLVLTGAAGLAALPFQASAKPTEPSKGRFSGKIVVITGATSGIGRATAEEFAQQGATVVFCGRRENLGRDVEQSIKDSGGSALYIRADVRLENDVQNFIQTAIATYGRIDIGINNAGVKLEGHRIDEENDDIWKDTMETNVGGVRHAMHYELKQMVKQGFGAIVNTASILGLGAIPMSNAYVTSKHAIIGLTRAAALDYAELGIRVNAVAPGAVNTPMIQRFIDSKKGDGKDWFKIISDGTPRKKMGEPREIAHAVLWLASEEASYINGEVLAVDSGKMISRL